MYKRQHYVPYALYAQQANTISEVLPIALGGTGVTNTTDLLKLLQLEKVDNSPDSIKPVSLAVLFALNEKLKKSDTVTLSNRINQKLNAVDTLNLSNRIQLKLNSRDTVNLSNRINGLNSSQPQLYYGVFYDTAKQATLPSTATAIKFNLQQLNNNINVINNNANNPTRIIVLAAGVYQINYHLQFIKLDAGSDELIVWIRKNSAALANSNNTYTIQGLGVKNNISNNFLVELAANDYIELFYSVRNINTILQGTISSTATPSRPATPSASISLHSVH